MSDRFLLYVGYFVHDKTFASIQTGDPAKVATPRITRSLSASDILASAVEFCGGDANRVSNWDVKVENGHIVFCEVNDAKALEWVRSVSYTEGMDVIEGGTMRVVPASEMDSIVASFA